MPIQQQPAPQHYAPPPAVQPREGSGTGTASITLGIIGLLAWIIPLAGYPVTILAIVLGARGMATGRGGTATAGLVMGIAGLIATVVNSIAGAWIYGGGG